MDIAPGTPLTPSLRLVRLLGEGGMGQVWVARHLTLGTEVAVKFVLPARAERDPAALTRLRREASLSAQIKSPHVVQTFDQGVASDGTPFIVMELLAGESLAARLDRAGPLSIRETGLLVEQVAEVLARADEVGVVHRDIKPANLFLIQSGYELFVKVLDFGIAKQPSMPSAGAMTETGAIVGTPRYMSPEQILDAKSASHAADLWAVAVVAYQSLTGRLPFEGETLARLSLAIHHGRFKPVSAIRATLPASFDAFFSRALAPDPRERFTSARALAEAFEAVVATAVDDLGAAPTEPAEVLAPATRQPQMQQVDTLAATGDDDHSSIRGGEDARGRPTFSGAASTLDSAGSVPKRKKARAPVATSLFAVLLLATSAIVAARAFTSSEPLPTQGAPAARSDETDAAKAPERTAKTEPPTTEDDVPAASAPPAPDAAAREANAPAVEPPGATKPAPNPAVRAAAKPVASATAVTSSSKPGCEQPFTVDPQGILHVKPECL